MIKFNQGDFAVQFNFERLKGKKFIFRIWAGIVKASRWTKCLEIKLRIHPQQGETIDCHPVGVPKKYSQIRIHVEIFLFEFEFMIAMTYSPDYNKRLPWQDTIPDKN